MHPWLLRPCLLRLPRGSVVRKCLIGISSFEAHFWGSAGGAAMHEPAPSGFDQRSLADLFKITYHGPWTASAATPRPRPSGSRANHRTATTVGCLVGGIVCITLVVGHGLCSREANPSSHRRQRAFVPGDGQSGGLFPRDGTLRRRGLRTFAGS